MIGSQPPKVHANCFSVGTKRVMASCEPIGRSSDANGPSPHPSPTALRGTRRPVTLASMKLVAIGIGSAIFGIGLLRDVFRAAEFRGAELWLVDVDSRALALMTGLAQRLNVAAGWDVNVHATAERREALPGADFVVTSVAVDRLATWRADHAMALSHGFASVLSENGGPGGLSHTLRSVPLMVEIGQDVERLAPSALMVNYTNPENRVCLALQRHTNVRFIGLCHSVAEAIDRCARVLGRPRTEIDVHAAGVNHFTWILAIRDARDGRDLLPDFLKRSTARDPGKAPLVRMLYERFGVYPAIDDDHVGEYLPWAAEIVGTHGYDFEGHERRSRRDAQALAAWGTGEQSVERLLAEPSEEAKIDHSSVQIMGDVIARRTQRRPSFILPNDGYLEGLPADSVIEVPGLVEAGVPRGIPVGVLPDHVRGLIAHELAIQDVAIEAALEGSRDLALRALLLDPVVTSARAAERYLDEVLRTHRDHLPRFWS
jgi:alpha-galactosidase